MSVAVHARVRGLAADAGLSVGEWLADLVVREVRLPVEEEKPVVDWDALLERGREAKALEKGRASLYAEMDPIEEIA